jgi:predicted membrane protein
MRVLGRLFATLVAGFILTMVVAAIAAVSAKKRLVPLDDPEADDVRLVAIFEPLAFRSTAGAFRGGTVDCWFGGGVIDLREATLDPAGATLAVRSIFGGGQVVVPESWRVTLAVTGVGGAGDTRPATDRPAEAPHLTIEGVVAFGGFGISSELPEDAERELFGQTAWTPSA